MFNSYWAFIIATIVATFVTIIGIWQHQGASISSEYHNYFGLGLIVAPIALFLLSNGRLWQDIGFSWLAIGLILFGAERYWNYRDRPWFEPPRTNCDGDCYGWFSFENPLMLKELLLVGAIAIAIGILLKLVRDKLLKQVKK
ncbi:hypothetical protein APA_4698 [Pseudanabaena sp. lw0831]|uniref:hypothetical protein n=1 Tax=Pseudanabaena sp. lw0831 TaxID=1357935 RepID=UPI00191653C6|nr:hypothetical protein [Pseudanabaena sp. lw0831]GBO52138.1 hypothetical protein APA_4698 [Pseudanabaena sp. lw0831]